NLCETNVRLPHSIVKHVGANCLDHAPASATRRRNVVQRCPLTVATPLVISACVLDKTAGWAHCSLEGATTMNDQRRYLVRISLHRDEAILLRRLTGAEAEGIEPAVLAHRAMLWGLWHVLEGHGSIN